MLELFDIMRKGYLSQISSVLMTLLEKDQQHWVNLQKIIQQLHMTRKS